MIDALHLRMTEALLFAAEEPLDEATLAARLPDGADVPSLLAALATRYGEAGVNLVKVGGKWQLRTAPDLHYLLEQHRQQPRRLSRAALETLAIIAYHQPITRAEIEEVRGVGLSRGTLDILLEIGWVRPRGRRRVPGRPVTYGTTDAFLEHFGLEDLKALPGMDELKAAGLLQGDPPPLRLATAPEDPADDLDPTAVGEAEAPPPSASVFALDGAEIAGDPPGGD
jgi:segregation and condensation protein B